MTKRDRMIIHDRKELEKMRFRRAREHEHSFRKERPRMPLGAVILMIIGLMTVLYFAVVYGLMPVLAMLTPA